MECLSCAFYLPQAPTNDTLCTGPGGQSPAGTSVPGPEAPGERLHYARPSHGPLLLISALPLNQPARGAVSAAFSICTLRQGVGGGSRLHIAPACSGDNQEEHAFHIHPHINLSVAHPLVPPMQGSYVPGFSGTYGCRAFFTFSHSRYLDTTFSLRRQWEAPISRRTPPGKW